MVLDARDIEIPIGAHVRYVDTGTIGEVIDVRTKSGHDWVKIEKNNLWYRADLVELLDEKDIKKSTYYDKEDDGEVDIEAMKEKVSSMEDMEMDSSVAEGGG